MDTSNYQGGTGGGESTVESVDWRTQWPADSRQKLVNKIIETLEKHYSFLGPEKLHEITSFAPRLEDKMFKTATTHDDYMRKISMKLLTVETKSANLMPNTLQSNSTGSSVNPSDPGSHGMHQGQPLPVPVPVPSNHPQVSASVSSILPSANGLSQPTLSNISTQNPSFHNMSGVQVQQNSVGVNMGQGIPSNNFVNQRQMPGRQQQQQQPQNLQPCHYRQHLHQIAKQSLQQSYSATSAQSHIQQQHQNLLQPGHFQPSSLSSVQQHQQPVIQHHQQSALRHQRQQPQASLVHHHHHHQQQQQQPQSNPMGQQTSAIGHQSSYSDMQQQQPPRLLSQQNNLSNVHQPHQHSVGQHNNFSAMHQQHLGPQSSSQLLGTQSGNSSMLSNKHSAHMMMQTKVSIPQHNWSMQGQRPQPELQQQVMPHLQTQSGQLQHHLNMKPQPNMSQGDMQQRLPTSGASQQQNVIDQQKQLFQQQRAMPEASSTSSDSTAQTGNPNSGDWQEEVYQKVKAMKVKYLPELTDLHQKIIGKLQHHDSLPQQAKNEQLEKMKKLKQICEICIQVLQVPKTNISPSLKETLSQHEKQIINIITTCNRKPGPTHLQQPHMTQLHPHETHINSPNSTMLQHQQLKLQIHRQQFLQKQQLLQHQQQQNQQQFNRNSKQQLQPIQLPHIVVKMESSLQRSQLKSGPPFSPQIPSPNIDQQNLMNSATTKSGTCTPLQSANSPFTMSSPSTPSTSHVVGDSEKVNSGISSLSNVGNVGHQLNAVMLPTQLLPFGTPGISASPLLAEFATQDENHGNNASVVSEKSSTIEQPIEHLLKVVKSISAKSLSASVSDIGSVVSMIDSIAGSGTGNNNKASTSRAAVGEDLVATTKCRLLQGKRKMERLTTAMPLNLVLSANSVNDSFKHLNNFDASELESTATSTIKRPRIETSNALLEELRGINRGLIDTMVDIDADSEVGKGTVVKCSFGAVNVSPIQPLRLLIPASYPTCSPILLDKSPVEVRDLTKMVVLESDTKEYEDLSIKAKWRFRNYMRTFSEPMSLEKMAMAWDVCAREVISEHAQQTGGGTFTSKYGAWEDCLTSTAA